MKNIILSLVTLLTISTEAQQLTLHTQYMFNDFALNPGVAGTNFYTPLNMSVRRQWVGIKEAPVTQFISVHNYLGYNIGLGMQLYNEATGPTRRTGFSFSGAYHLIIKNTDKTDQHTLSFGMSGAINQLTLDKTKLIPHIANDPTVDNAYASQVVPDINFGLYYHNLDYYYLGFSVFNIIQTKADISNIPNGLQNTHVRHYYLMGGTTIQLDKPWLLLPSFLVQGIEATVTQIDIGTRLMYNKKYWLGASYRHKDAIIPMIGINLHESRFGYSYDITLSKIRNYSSGTHELTCTILLNRVGENFYKTQPGNYRIKRGRFKPRKQI